MKFPVCHILAVAIAVAASTAAAEIPEPLKSPLFQSRDFYGIYLHSLMLIDPRLAYEHKLNTPATIEAVRREIAGQRELAAKLAVDTPGYPQAEIERFVLPATFRYRLQYGLQPTTDTLRRLIDAKPAQYPKNEAVVASQIFVEKEDFKTDNELSATLQRIAERLATEVFEKVAFDYYETRGVEYSGSLGRIARGDIPDHNFDLFVRSDPSQAFFGPVEMPKGYLFGKVYRKFAKDADPVHVYYEEALNDYRQGAAAGRLAKIYEEQTHRLLPTVHLFDGQSTLGLRQIAYVVDGTSETFAGAIKRLPQYGGNRRDPRFLNAMAQKALNDDLILHSPLADTVRKSDEFAYLMNANRNAFLVHEAVRRELDKVTTSPDTLGQYYDRHIRNYSEPDRVRLLLVSLRRGKPHGTSPYLVHMQQKADFATISRVREDYLNSPTTETLRTMSRHHPNLTTEEQPMPVSQSTLSRAVQVAVADIPSGAVTRVIVEDDYYRFAQVLTRQNGQPKPFETVIGRVADDYMAERRGAIMKNFGSSLLVPDALTSSP